MKSKILYQKFLIFLGANLLQLIDSFDPGPPSLLNRRLFQFIEEAESLGEINQDGTKMVLKLLRRKVFDLEKYDDTSEDEGVDKVHEEELGVSSSVDVREEDETSKKDSENEGDSHPPSLFHKFSPLCIGKRVYDCEFCSKTYESVPGLNDHIKKHHGPENIDPSLKEPKGTCKLPHKYLEDEECGQTFTTRQINKHLKTHHVDIPPGKFLRGFQQQADGKFECVFLKKTDPDPDVDVKVEITEVEYEQDHMDNFLDVENNEELGGGVMNFRVINNDETQAGDVAVIQSDCLTSPINVDNRTRYCNDGSPLLGFTPETENIAKQRSLSRKLQSMQEIEEVKNKEDILYLAKEALEKGSDDDSGNNNDSHRETESHGEKEKNTVPEIVDEFYSEQLPILIEEVSEDSDVEPCDSVEFTHRRIAKKMARHKQRNDPDELPLHKRKENEEVAADLENFIKLRAISTVREDTSTITKCLGHIVSYEDSLLNYEHSKDKSFSLKRNVSFDAEDFLPLKIPLEWVQDTITKQATRSTEKLKAHAIYVDFLSYKLENSNLGSSIEALLRKRAISDGLEKITKYIKTHRMYKKFDAVANREKVEIETAKLCLDPDLHVKEADAVSTWNNSQEAKDQMKKYDKLYKCLVETQKIGDKNFASFAHFVFFNLVKSDKQRGGSYTFLNKHYMNRYPLYLPPGYNDYNNLPAGWNPHKPPTPEAEPNHYQFRLSGGLAGQKGQNATKITITPQTMELIDRYREGKEIVGLTEDPESRFFVNIKGEPLAEISSNLQIWKLFEAVTGASKAKTTKVRRGAEKTIRGNQAMTDNILELNNHSNPTGMNVYHKTNYIDRAEFVSYAASLENETANSPSKSIVTRESLKRRVERNENDVRISKELAQKMLDEKKGQRNISLGAKVKVLPRDRAFLQSLITSKRDSEIYRATTGKFPGTTSLLFMMKPIQINLIFSLPGDQAWKKLFNRFLDSAVLSEEESLELLNIEKRIFNNVKSDVVKETSSDLEWVGSAKQNSISDHKISKCIKSSFQYYERSGRGDGPTFFKFKK